PIRLAVLASYLPLHSVPGAEQLAERSWPASVTPLIAQQVIDPRDEQAVRSGIERLTAIEDDVSEKVRAQYEENPYP
ncbi:hypothetical protein QIG78_26280, partial [Klebsiella pneumoniae]|nr:hypothetical protein [Klebsiella pneumoniae]